MKKPILIIIVGLGIAVLVFAAVKAGVSNGNRTLAAKPVTSQDISHRADDLPPPITRTQNQKVLVELETKEVTAEISPGITYEYWTYNGTVPGPFIRVKEGDTVEVRLTHAHEHATASLGTDQTFAIDAFPVNVAEAHGDEADGHMDMDDAHMPNMSQTEHEAAGHGAHSVDLHAVLGPGGGAMLMQVKPNETNAFEFKATRPGLYIYHCASPHIPTHIANGMYGMILVEPKEGLTKVDHEYYVMQGELYTKGKFGEKGHQEFDVEKLKDEHPEYFVFNGRVGALTGERALQSKVGETVRIFFGVGTFVPSNFHVIGGIMDKLYPEGDIISPPHRNIQTTLVPAGGAMMTEFKTEVPGKLLLVDHALMRAIDKGAVGELIVTGDEQPDLFKKVP